MREGATQAETAIVAFSKLYRSEGALQITLFEKTPDGRLPKQSNEDEVRALWPANHRPNTIYYSAQRSHGSSLSRSPSIMSSTSNSARDYRQAQRLRFVLFLVLSSLSLSLSLSLSFSLDVDCSCSESRAEVRCGQVEGNYSCHNGSQRWDALRTSTAERWKNTGGKSNLQYPDWLFRTDADWRQFITKAEEHEKCLTAIAHDGIKLLYNMKLTELRATRSLRWVSVISLLRVVLLLSTSTVLFVYRRGKSRYVAARKDVDLLRQAASEAGGFCAWQDRRKLRLRCDARHGPQQGDGVFRFF